MAHRVMRVLLLQVGRRLEEEWVWVGGEASV